jgi:choline dehydrogenase-like flavoprotein
VIFPVTQNSINSGGFHVGGTMPMKVNPVEETDTNLLGTPKGWENIHVIDSSVFPSLPGTTIGLLAMANAARIASEIEVS